MQHAIPVDVCRIYKRRYTSLMPSLNNKPPMVIAGVSCRVVLLLVYPHRSAADILSILVFSKLTGWILWLRFQFFCLYCFVPLRSCFCQSNTDSAGGINGHGKGFPPPRSQRTFGLCSCLVGFAHIVLLSIVQCLELLNTICLAPAREKNH